MQPTSKEAAAYAIASCILFFVFLIVVTLLNNWTMTPAEIKNLFTPNCEKKFEFSFRRKTFYCKCWDIAAPNAEKPYWHITLSDSPYFERNLLHDETTNTAATFSQFFFEKKIVIKIFFKDVLNIQLIEPATNPKP